jgi:hypothetical protein
MQFLRDWGEPLKPFAVKFFDFAIRHSDSAPLS